MKNYSQMNKKAKALKPNIKSFSLKIRDEILKWFQN